MSLLQTYVDGLREGNAEKVASIFATDALFDDAAPKAMGMDSIVLNGQAAVRENFDALLAGGGLNIENVCINGNAMRYDIVLAPEMVIRALGVIQVEDDKVIQYNVEAVK